MLKETPHDRTLEPKGSCRSPECATGRRRMEHGKALDSLRRGSDQSLTGAVNRKSRFAGTEGEALKGSRTDRSAAARQMLDESDPSRVDLSGVTPTGLVLQGAKSAVVDPLLNLLLKQDNSGRTFSSQGFVAQGPARDALVSRLMPFAARRTRLWSSKAGTRGMVHAPRGILSYLAQSEYYRLVPGAKRRKALETLKRFTDC